MSRLGWPLGSAVYNSPRVMSSSPQRAGSAGTVGPTGVPLDGPDPECVQGHGEKCSRAVPRTARGAVYGSPWTMLASPAARAARAPFRVPYRSSLCGGVGGGQTFHDAGTFPVRGWLAEMDGSQLGHELLP
ncbi:hypothetical protein GCM10009546_61880 [Actinomadura livida]|uniref:Uncharacterized protein n=1 Tax=Actinomadura livida TaxID=79909 RepID=A0ABN1FHR7_9ACTN|nr:hypothetical protein GCM10010208_69960 [Actinomadura livida]